MVTPSAVDQFAGAFENLRRRFGSSPNVSSRTLRYSATGSLQELRVNISHRSVRTEALEWSGTNVKKINTCILVHLFKRWDILTYCYVPMDHITQLAQLI